jgi:AcrR family transcriptional regulator
VKGGKASSAGRVTPLDSRAMPSSARAPTADLTRQRLIRAALELFATRGYHDTTTAQIAKKAGVAEGTIYRHFPSKQQLLNELYRAAMRWAAKVVQDTEAAEKPHAQLARVAQALAEGAVRDPTVVKLGFLERLEPVLDDESRKTAREFRAALERVIAQGKAEGTIRAGAADVWAGVWLAVVIYALEKIVAREWKPGDAAVGLVIDGAWEAVSV